MAKFLIFFWKLKIFFKIILYGIFTLWTCIWAPIKMPKSVQVKSTCFRQNCLGQLFEKFGLLFDPTVWSHCCGKAASSKHLDQTSIKTSSPHCPALCRTSDQQRWSGVSAPTAAGAASSESGKPMPQPGIPPLSYFLESGSLQSGFLFNLNILVRVNAMTRIKLERA